MKATKLLLIILVLATVAQAGPRRHGSNRHAGHARGVRLHVGFYSPSYYGPRIGSYPYYGGRYNDYYYNLRYTPILISPADSVRLIYMDAETAGDQITRLDKIRKQGLITDREFKRLKKRLLSQIGRMVPVHRRTMDVGQLLNELETLHRLVEEGVLTDREYASQQRRMLARL